MGYDIIGDIHGHADKLEALLKKLGYREEKACWRHLKRTVIFLGDFIDGGPVQMRTVEIARRMVGAGSAMAIMGNHEFNAIAWHTPHPRKPGEYLRPHGGELGAKNRGQHERFLAEVEHDPARHAEIIGWFKTLPLWLELDGIRVVHACWHQRFMDWLDPQLAPGRLLSDDLLPEATIELEDKTEKDTPTPTVFKAAEAVTKGIEVPLPPPHSFVDNGGVRRTRVRIRWWQKDATTFRKAAILDDALLCQIPDLPIPLHHRLQIPTDRPIFFGHYWLSGVPSLLAPTIACLDYSAGKGGPLVAYRWDGEPTLDGDKFISTD